MPKKSASAPSTPLLGTCACQITWEKLYGMIYYPIVSKACRLSRPEFIQKVLPEGLLKASVCSKNGKFSGSTESHFSNAKGSACARFKHARDYLIELRRPDGETYRYDTCPAILSFQKNWEGLVPLLTAEECEKKQDLEKTILNLLKSIRRNDEPIKIYERIYPVYAAGQYSQVLSILSVIASTLFPFHVMDEKDAEYEKDYQLRALVLPDLPVEGEVSANLVNARKRLTDSSCDLEAYGKLIHASLNDENITAAEKHEAQYLLHRKACQCGKGESYRSYLRESAVAGYEKAMFCLNNETAKKLLDESSKRSVRECCQNCEEILRMTPKVSDEYRGQASFILFQYTYSRKYTASSGETPVQFLEISHNCGYPDAEECYKVISDIIPKYSRSEESSSGLCYFNTRNRYTETFLKSMPESWSTEFDDVSVIYKGESAKRILLVDDDFDKNLSDLLSILQGIKDTQSVGKKDKIEIFIRHNSEVARAMIDTASNHMGDVLIPVYMIDDDKIAAQQLLSRHPLFYPLTGVKLPENPKVSAKRPILNFVVVGTSAVAEWLIREAFWMMGDKNNGIETKISLLAPEGEAFIVRLKSKFPGMVKSDFHIEGIELPDISGKNINFDSNELLDQVADIIKESPHCYFAVATPDDERNLSIAMRIREASIRHYISSKADKSKADKSDTDTSKADKSKADKSDTDTSKADTSKANKSEADTQLNHPFPIAFLCRQDKLAWLSRSMVVEKEKHGNRWFNTWSLIPFGEISNRYSWDEITGGTFQQLALCIHYQYSGIKVTEMNRADSEACNTKVHNAKKDFFFRQYNQDSSYSLALSIPYRIFQFSDASYNRISPSAWSILDKTVFSTAEQLLKLSGRINNFFMKENDWKKIAEWEHARWVRWMLSRGWLPASFNAAVFAYKNGNPRQQLFVARLHPCICSYEDLAELQKVLRKECGINKDFYTADLDNVKATKEILELKWLRAEQEKQVETER